MTGKRNGSMFGSYLRRLREKKKLKLNKAAIDMRIDPTLFSKYENGTRSPKKETLDRIATYFRVSQNEMARMISIDKQRTHYKRLSSANESNKDLEQHNEK